MTIRSRVDRLEAECVAKENCLDVFRVFVSIDPAKREAGVVKIRQLGCGDREWLREDGETEEEFFHRVRGEAEPAVPPNLRRFLCFHRDEED